MRAQHQHRQAKSNAVLNSVDFAPMNLTGRIMKEDSCWEECESDYEESLSSYDLDCLGDIGCE